MAGFPYWVMLEKHCGKAEIKDYHVSKSISSEIQEFKDEWEKETNRLFHLSHSPLPAQSELIGAIWEEPETEDVILSAAGSHPGDLHKLWRARTPKSYHLEYGYSCMGYEIPAAIGVKMADPRRDVSVWVGDGTYLMNPTEIVTSIQEGVKLIIIVVNNHGFQFNWWTERIGGKRWFWNPFRKAGWRKRAIGGGSPRN